MRVEDAAGWKIRWKLEKYADDDLSKPPVAIRLWDGNALVNGGISALWQMALGNGTATGGQALTFFNNANAHLGVGDSTTAEAATQTDLQAATNKLRKAMDATFPTHTDGTGTPNRSVTWQSSFGSSDANFAWQEVAIFNGSSGGRMLNRKVVSLGTKATGTWVLSGTTTITP